MKKRSNSKKFLRIAECLSIEEMKAIEVFCRGCRGQRFLGRIGPNVRLVSARFGSATRMGMALIGSCKGIYAVLSREVSGFRPSAGLREVMARLAKEEGEKEPTETQETEPPAPVATAAFGQDQEFVGPPEPAVDQMEESIGAPPEPVAVAP